MGNVAKIAVVIGMLVAGSARADAESDTALFEANLRQQWAGIDEQVQLRRIDKEALSEVYKWRAGEEAPSAMAGKEGRVVFPFGPTVPRIICSPVRFCDIELQAGEEFTSLPVSGDSDGWIIDPVSAGGVYHVVVKPKASNLYTNLGIYTNRRVYQLELQAHATQSMPFVAFSYQEDREAKWRALVAQHEQKAASARSEDTAGEAARKAAGEYEIIVKPGALNFNYEISREGRLLVRNKIDWEPKRAFDDGTKTIIEMPRSVLAREMPILLVRDGDGKDKIVNYRVKGVHFIVDRLFSYAVLVKGVGRRQERVAVRREED